MRRHSKLKRDRSLADKRLQETLVALRTAIAERDHALTTAHQLYEAARDEIEWALQRAPAEMQAWCKAGIAHRIWWAITGRIGGGR